MDSRLTDGKYVYKYMLETASVCLEGWRVVLGLAKSRFYVIRKKFEGNYKQKLVQGNNAAYLAGKFTLVSIAMFPRWGFEC